MILRAAGDRGHHVWWIAYNGASLLYYAVGFCNLSATSALLAIGLSETTVDAPAIGSRLPASFSDPWKKAVLGRMLQRAPAYRVACWSQHVGSFRSFCSIFVWRVLAKCSECCCCCSSCSCSGFCTDLQTDDQEVIRQAYWQVSGEYFMGSRALLFVLRYVATLSWFHPAAVFCPEVRVVRYQTCKRCQRFGDARLVPSLFMGASRLRQARFV